jgi:hypothetical protein
MKPIGGAWQEQRVSPCSLIGASSSLARSVVVSLESGDYVLEIRVGVEMCVCACVCGGGCLCMTPLSSFNTILFYSPTCSRKKGQFV